MQQRWLHTFCCIIRKHRDSRGGIRSFGTTFWHSASRLRVLTSALRVDQLGGGPVFRDADGYGRCALGWDLRFLVAGRSSRLPRRCIVGSVCVLGLFRIVTVGAAHAKVLRDPAVVASAHWSSSSAPDRPRPDCELVRKCDMDGCRVASGRSRSVLGEFRQGTGEYDKWSPALLFDRGGASRCLSKVLPTRSTNPFSSFLCDVHECPL
jgi:hypothetical protein